MVVALLHIQSSQSNAARNSCEGNQNCKTATDLKGFFSFRIYGDNCRSVGTRQRNSGAKLDENIPTQYVVSIV
jgi:hypothetical protein